MFLCIGLGFSTLAFYGWWRGKIGMGRHSVVNRSTQPLLFYFAISFHCLLAVSCLVAAIFFWLHPGPKLDD